MCGRSSITKTEKELEERFNASFYSDDIEQYNPLPNYNVAPSHIMPVITNHDRAHFSAMRWGFIPNWAADPKIGYKMINARIETLFEKSSFKKAITTRRCIIPADGFYEWKKSTASNGKQTKQPYRIQAKDQSIFSMAGIWDRWQDPQGQTVLSFAVITQPANLAMQDIHDRMPAILTKTQEEHWLSNELPAKDLVDMISPYPNELTQVYPVSDRIGNVKNNDPQLIVEKENPTDKIWTLF